MPKAPRRTYNYNFGYDNPNPPPLIECGDIDDDAKEVIHEIMEYVCEPISKAEFAVLYAKLKVLCKWHAVPADEKIIMAAYYDELKKFPAQLVREAMKPKYEWFPSYLELENEIKERGEHLLLLQKNFG